MPLLRRLLWGFIAIVVVTVAGVASYEALKPPPPSLVDTLGWGAPFTLTDHRSAPITEAAIAGHPSILFFGFTHCPEVCPTTLYDVAGWLEELGSEGEPLKAFFVSIDPERDTPEVMANYVTNFSDRITGITGASEAVAAMAKSWRVYAEKVPLEGGGYTMDHTASIYLVRADGTLQGTIAYVESPDTALEKLRRLAGK